MALFLSKNEIFQSKEELLFLWCKNCGTFLNFRGEATPQATPQYEWDDDPRGKETQAGRFTNMYVVESALETFKSLRIPQQGCPLIKVFCEELLEKRKTHSLEQIFKQFVALELQEYNSGGKKWSLTPAIRVLGNTTEDMNLNLHDLLMKTHR